MLHKNINKTKLSLIILVSTLLLSCAKPLTSSLFLQNKRVEIFLPTKEEENKQSAVLGEKVSYQQHIDTIKNSKKADNTKKIDTLNSMELKEVTITSNRPKIKVSSIRNGHITLKFLISIPKIFMNPDYRIILTPSLINGDTTESLKPIVFIGKKFREVQTSEAKKINTLDSISTERMKSDSIYFDNKKYKSFIKTIEKYYLLDYYNKYYKLMDYIRWYNIMQNRFMYFNALNEGKYKEKLNKKALSLLNNIYRAKILGRDTLKYSKEYYQILKQIKDSKDNKDSTAFYKRKISKKIVPYRFSDIYTQSPNIDSLQNFSVTEIDSMRVAQHTYKYVDIAKDQRFAKNKDILRSSLQLSPIKDVKDRVDIEPNKGVSIMYIEEIPVTTSLAKKLKVSLSTQIQAIDKSTWRQDGIDTLSFVVTGLNDLADTTLLDAYKYNEKYYNDYKAGLERLRVRDYRGALTILRFYPDYNATICLIALGMNDKALELVDKIPQTGKSLYLKSIILVRLGKLEDAKKTLIEACKKESFLGYKADIEPELSKLLEDSSFKQKIQDIADGLE